ncbi:MAG: TRAP transporter large permease subunit [Chloroflexota bacterium]|nr:TRAP transporter large permease subunit [Chloroflexota bacterium]MDE2885669.1 TRAP transporter large permease subunit [Chloroflexota bacterium]
MAIRTRFAAVTQTSWRELYARVGAANILLALSIAVMVGLQIGQRWWLPNGYRFGVLHIAFAVLIVALHLLTTTRSSKRSAKLLPWLSIVIVVIWFAYFYPLADFEVADRFGYATRPDMVIGGLLAIPVFYLAWRSFGPLFPAIGLVAILYGFFAADVPGHFKGPPIPAERVMSRYVLDASWSGLVRLFANFVWLIMFWGMLLEVAGARKLVTRLAQRLAARFTSGPGLVTVGTSGVVGSFTGGGASDVAITGPITIPMMRRAGFRGAEAAALEAAASSAAAVTPPILGAVAFIMADRLGVAYKDILAMTIVPAILWYVALISYVVSSSKLRAIRLAKQGGLPSVESPDTAASGPGLLTSTALPSTPAQPDSMRTLIFAAITVIVPLGVLLVQVLRDTELYTAVFQAFLTLVAVSLIFRAEKSLETWWRGIVRAATFASSVSVTIVIVNIISDTIFFTGLGSRMGDIVYDLSGGHLLVASLLMLVFGIFLSAGMPTLVIYFIMVFTFQPVLIEFAVPVEATHFVAFYMGALNQLIMPVAASVLVAAGIAGVRYWDAGMEAAKLILPLVLLPFLFVFAPQLLLGVGEDTVGHMVLLVGSVVVSFTVINVAMGGWLGRPLVPAARGVLLLIGILSFIGVYRSEDVFLWAGLIAGLMALLSGAGLSYANARRAPVPEQA